MYAAYGTAYGRQEDISRTLKLQSHCHVSRPTSSDMGLFLV